jgi:hypothetical protein
MNMKNITTRDCAEMVRCPVCREGAGDRCNFLLSERVRPARDYETSFHSERLTEAIRTSGIPVIPALRGEISWYALCLLRAVAGLFYALFRRSTRR